MCNLQVNQYMNRAEELKQCFKTRSHSSPDELLARYSKDHPELKEALHLASIAEIRVSYSPIILLPFFFGVDSLHGNLKRLLIILLLAIMRKTPWEWRAKRNYTDCIKSRGEKLQSDLRTLLCFRMNTEHMIVHCHSTRSHLRHCYQYYQVGACTELYPLLTRVISDWQIDFKRGVYFVKAHLNSSCWLISFTRCGHCCRTLCRFRRMFNHLSPRPPRAPLM